MEKTEKKLKQECNKRDYYCKKVPTHTATGHGAHQEADFLIAKENVYFVECKECAGDTFSFSRFTQKAKLRRVTKKTDAITPLLLINFVKHKKIILMNLQDYITIEKSMVFKNGNKRMSLNVNDMHKYYIHDWNSIFEKIK